MKNERVLGSTILKVIVFWAALAPAVIGVDRAVHIALLPSPQPVVTNWYLQLAGCLAAYALCLVYLLWSSGHKAPDGHLGEGWAAKVPFDLILLIGVGAGAALVGLWVVFFADYLPWAAMEAHPGGYWDKFYQIYGVGATCLAILHGVLMSFSGRVKLGGWWKNTIVYRLLALVWTLLKHLAKWLLTAARWFFGLLGRMFRSIGRFLGDIPLIWKGALAVFAVSFAELICLMNVYDDGGKLLFWLIEHLLLVPVILYALIQMRKLQKGARALAEGDLAYKIDTNRMIWDFKRHGEDLNSLAGASAAATEKQLKSERFKTELITNVSHDIKTPLTSIISYADLIGREGTDAGQVQEYADVLKRQSEKLKRLLEDLIEASKASTGNLEVDLETCNACTLISQAEGEYQEKVDAAGLTLVTRVPEEPLYILADGRRIWRVFDNLMNNVCKYSQEGTRVYLTLEKKGSEAVFTLRNTSREALNIDPDELMERFVRGDASRGTEGSGLGLSIAKSFTELQKGRMDIAIDGDLFKVTLTFPAL